MPTALRICLPSFMVINCGNEVRLYLQVPSLSKYPMEQSTDQGTFLIPAIP